MRESAPASARFECRTRISPAQFGEDLAYLAVVGCQAPIGRADAALGASQWAFLVDVLREFALTPGYAYGKAQFRYERNNGAQLIAFSYHERQNGGRHFKGKRLHAALAQIGEPFVERRGPVVHGSLLFTRRSRRHLGQDVLETQNDDSCTGYREPSLRRLREIETKEFPDSIDRQ